MAAMGNLQLNLNVNANTGTAKTNIASFTGNVDALGKTSLVASQNLSSMANESIKNTANFNATAHAADLAKKSIENWKPITATAIGITTLASEFKNLTSVGVDTFTAIGKASQLSGSQVFSLLQDIKSLVNYQESLKKAAIRTGIVGVASIPAVQFEKSFSDVEKVLNGTDVELKKVEQTIKRLSVDTIPLATDQINSIAAAGATMGLSAKDIEPYVIAVSQASTAFGMLPEEAGNAFGVLRNIYQLNTNQLSSLADQINVVGDNSNATERDIINILTRSGEAAKGFGLMRSEAISLAAATLSLGKPPEIAATAINNLLTSLQDPKGQSKDFLKGLDALGISADDLSKSIANNANKALTDFLSKVAELDTASRTSVLNAMFGKGTDTQTIASLVSSIGELNRINQLAGDSSAYAGSALATFEKRVDTTSAKITLLVNSVKLVAIEMIDPLLPSINAASDGVRSLFNAVSTMASENPVVSIFARVAFVMLPLAGLITATGFAFRTLITVMPSLATAGSIAMLGFETIKILITGTGFAAATLSTTLGLLGKDLLKLAGGPIGLTAIGVVGLIAVWEKYKNTQIKIGEVTATLSETMSAAWQVVSNTFGDFFEIVITGSINAIKFLTNMETHFSATDLASANSAKKMEFSWTGAWDAIKTTAYETTNAIIRAIDLVVGTLSTGLSSAISQVKKEVELLKSGNVLDALSGNTGISVTEAMGDYAKKAVKRDYLAEFTGSVTAQVTANQNAIKKATSVAIEEREKVTGRHIELAQTDDLVAKKSLDIELNNIKRLAEARIAAFEEQKAANDVLYTQQKISANQHHQTEIELINKIAQAKANSISQTSKLENTSSNQTLTNLDRAYQAILKIESAGGKTLQVNKTSHALGQMQVLPSTLRDPGYGVKPFQPAVDQGITRAMSYGRLVKFVQENEAGLKKFGEDYFKGLVNHYGSVEKAVNAYGEHTAAYMAKFKKYYAELGGQTKESIALTGEQGDAESELAKIRSESNKAIIAADAEYAKQQQDYLKSVDDLKLKYLELTGSTREAREARIAFDNANNPLRKTATLNNDTATLGLLDRVMQAELNKEFNDRLKSLAEERLQLEMTAKEWSRYQNAKITDDPILQNILNAEVEKTTAKKNLEYKISFKDKELTDGLAKSQRLAKNLESTFGNVGKAIGGMIEAMSNYSKTLNDVEVQRKAIVDDERSSPDQIAYANIQAAEQVKIAELDKYATMTESAKSFFKEGTAGYKAMEAATKAFRIYEMLLSAQSMAQNLSDTASQVVAWVTGEATKTTATVATVAPSIAASQAKGMANAAEAVSAQATIPIAGFGLAAAMAAIMAAIGFAVNGGGGDVNIAENRQKTQGSGTVLGDATAKSESISKSLEFLKSNSDIMLPLTNRMASSLRNIESNIGIISVQQSRSLSGLSLPSGVKTGTVYDNGYAKAAGGIGLISSGIGLAGGVGAIGASLGLGGTIASGGALTAAGLAPGAGVLAGGAGLGASAMLGGAGLVVGLLAMAVPAIGKFINKILGFSTKVTSLDNGIEVARQSVGQVAESGIDARAYEDVQIKKKAFFITMSTKLKTFYGDLDSQTTDAMTNVIVGMRDTLGMLTGTFDVTAGDFLNNINNFVIDIGRISLKGMTGEQVNKALSEVFSKLGDQMAAAAFPFILDFQKQGEGLFQTLTRVATGIEQANVYLEIAGIKAVKYGEIINKQGDVFAEIARQSIVAQETAQGIADIISTLDGTGQDIISTYKQLSAIRDSLNLTGLQGNDLSRFSLIGAGGLSELESAVSAYTDKYFSDAEKLNMALTKTSSNFVKLGLAMPSTTAEFRKLVESIDTSTESGQKLQGQVLALADSFSNTADMAAKAVESMQSNLSTAESDLKQAYDRESGLFKQAIDDFGNFAKSLKEYLDSLMLSDLSTKSPLEKYQEAKRQFDEVNALIASGDMAKQKEGLGRLQGVSQTFLESSRGYNASSAGYIKDFATVTAALNSGIAKATTSQDINQLQLNALTDSVSQLIKIDESVLSVKQAIDALTIAQVGLKDAQNAMAKAAQDSIAAAKSESERINQQRFADLESKRLADYEAGLKATAQAQYPLNTVAPNTYINGQTSNQAWEQVLGQFNKEHAARFGLPMNREWTADEDAKKAKAVLDEQYKALAMSQNTANVQNAINGLKAQNPFVHQQYDPLKRYAKGGVSNVPAIFGEAGAEAAVPLPDGRSIPVTFINSSNSDNSEIVTELKALVKSQAENNAELKKQNEILKAQIKVNQTGYMELIDKADSQIELLDNIDRRERAKA
jgi:TP901 family phage tail tape measure protein